MWESKEGRRDRSALDACFDRFDRQAGDKIPAAFPGFHDIDRDASTQPSHGFLDPRAGETFRQSLTRALASKPRMIQIATWNDFGEGTEAEPTREVGYCHLESIQNARRGQVGNDFTYLAADLRVPLRIHQLRKRFATALPARSALDQAADLIALGDVASSLRIISRLEEASPPP